MQFAQLAVAGTILVAVQVVFVQAQYPPQRHWYMVNRNNPAEDPRMASIYGDAPYRGGLADDLPPLQRSALTDFLARYFPRLFRPSVEAADPLASLPSGATVIPFAPTQALDSGAVPLPYDTFPNAQDDFHAPDSYNVPAHAAHSAYPSAQNDYNVPAHATYTVYNHQRPSNYGNRGSYASYPGRGHAYPPGLSYPLDPYQAGYKKSTL